MSPGPGMPGSQLSATSQKPSAGFFQTTTPAAAGQATGPGKPIAIPARTNPVAAKGHAPQARCTTAVSIARLPEPRSPAPVPACPGGPTMVDTNQSRGTLLQTACHASGTSDVLKRSASGAVSRRDCQIFRHDARLVRNFRSYLSRISSPPSVGALDTHRFISCGTGRIRDGNRPRAGRGQRPPGSEVGRAGAPAWERAMRRAMGRGHPVPFGVAASVSGRVGRLVPSIEGAEAPRTGVAPSQRGASQ